MNKDKNKKLYIEVMEQTKCGWNAKGEYIGMGCPDDLEFVATADLKHKGKCFISCEDCWRYVLDNKWKVEGM